MKRAPKSVWIVLGLLCFAGILRATLPQTVIGTWTSAANLSQARSNAASVMLSDGRILIIGGDSGNGPLQSAEFFATDGTVSSAAALNVARSRHFAVVLKDGRVLVGGGVTTGGGTTNSAEIYDATSDSWNQAGVMSEARAGATAALLQDGRVVMAGGDNFGTPSNTIEVYDPASGAFSFAGTMSSARTKHAMAVLPSGTVLIVGGFDGTNALASSDVFDSSAGTVTPGPSMATARYAHSATSLLDGRVLFAGGVTVGNNGTVELASAEIFDPVAAAFSTSAATLATTRQGHQAFLLPKNNNALIVGGTSNGQPVGVSELYSPWQDTFTTTGTNVTPRSDATGSTMQQDGFLLAAGGHDVSGNTLASTELYAFPTVKTDAADYAPGTIVTITGSGWKSGETVTLTLVESPLIDTHPVMTAVADSNGNIINQQFSPDDHDENIRFYLTAVGSQSGLQAQNTFTDSQPTSVSLNPASVTVLAGGSAVYTTSVVMGGNTSSCTITLSVSPNPVTTGATPAFSGGANPFTTNASFWRTLTVPTTTTGPVSGRTQPGTYSFTVTAGKGADCQGGGTGPTTSGTLIVAGTVTHFAVTGFPSPVTAGASQSFTVTALDSNNNPAIGYTGTVHFTSSDGQAVLPANYTFTGADNGVHTFNATLGTAGTQSITATDAVNGAITGTQSGIVVNAGATAKLLVSGYPSPVTAGTSNSFTVTAEDTFGNLTAGYVGTVHFTSSDGAAVLPANHTFTTGTGSKDNGVATFSATLNTAGTQSVTATDTANLSITGTQTGIVVNPATVNSTTTVTSSSNPSAYGTSVNFTATVNRASGTNTPTGTVAIKDGATTICTTGNLSGGGGTSTASCSVSNLSVTGSPHSITAVYGGDSNFNGSTSSVLSQVVNPKALTVSGITASNKPYDGTTTATLNTGGAALVGVVSGDTVTLSAVGATGTFSDKNVGTGKTVTIAGLTIGGASAGNYTLTQPTTTADITSLTLTASIIGNPTKVYDGNTNAVMAASNFSVSGTVGTESFSITQTAGAYNSKAVATATTVTATLAGGDFGAGPGTLASNYTLPTSASGPGQITPKTLTASIVGNPTKTYDGTTAATLTSANFALAGLVAGESITVTQTAGTYNSKDVLSANNVNATLAAGDFTAGAGTLLTNYTLPATASGAGQITAKTLTGSIVGNPTKTYDGTTTATLTSANFSLLGLVSSESITVTQTTGTYNSKDVATANTVSANLAPTDFTATAGTLTNNYVLPTTANGPGHINKANATINVVGYSTIYDGDPHTATGTAVGVQSENLAGLDLAGTTHTNAGTYNDNWTFTDVTGNYNDATGSASDAIARANAVINVTPYSATYDGNAHTATGTATGVKGESLAGLDLSGTTHTHAGNFTDPWTFTDVTGNYYNANSTVLDVISKANAVINVTPYSVTYDAAAHTAGGTAIGVLGESLGGLDLSGTTHTNAGDYPADPWSFIDVTGDYNNSNGTTHDHIAKATATVVVNAYHVTYNANPHTASGTATGVGGADLSAVLNLSGTSHTNAGDYPSDSWSFLGGSNYNDASGTVHDVIDKATAVINVAPYHVTYDGHAHIAAGTATGVGGVDLSTDINLAGTTHTNAGDYPSDSWAFSGGANYNDASGTVHDAIDRANAVITVNAYNVVYSGAASTATGTAIGVQGESLSGLSLGGTTHTNAGSYIDSWTFTDVTGNYDNTSGTVNDNIAKATAIIMLNPYNVTYNGSSHTATGTAKGVLNESLTGLDLSATIHTNAGNYSDAWTFTDVTGNYNNASGMSADVIAKANATINVTPYSVAYDGSPHTATGTAKGVLNESLSGLNLSGTTHTNPGDYQTDTWTFSDSTGNYNNASGSIHDLIGYGTCNASIGPGQVILPPINSDGTSVYPRKGGSTIPVKFRVCNAAGGSISNSAAVFAGTGGTLTMLSAVRGTIDNVNETTGTDVPDVAFRWDSSGQQWIFNMATSNLASGSTYAFRINLAYGSINFVVGVK